MPEQKITGFYQDEEGHWVAELACGHSRHMRHNPPWSQRPWVLEEAGRVSFIGRSILCRDCEKTIKIKKYN